jgi:hypothetical protein
MILTVLQMIPGKIDQFSSTQPTAEQDGQDGAIPRSF